MASRLLLLDDSGALRKMFDIESIDKDRGVIENGGYYSGLSSVFSYARGAYNDFFGLTTAQKFFNKRGITILEISRDVKKKQAYLTLETKGIPSSIKVMFAIPKET